MTAHFVMDWFVTWRMIYLGCLQGGRLIDVVRCDHCINALPREPTRDVIMHSGFDYYSGSKLQEKSAKGVYMKASEPSHRNMLLKHHIFTRLFLKIIWT
jgi:hypothetical protein